MTKRIIVTGGAGYIGSHTCIELIQRGVSVVVLDDLSNSSIDMLDKIEAITGEKPEFYKVDVSDGAALAQAFASIQCMGSQKSCQLVRPRQYKKPNRPMVIQSRSAKKSYKNRFRQWGRSCDAYHFGILTQ